MDFIQNMFLTCLPILKRVEVCTSHWKEGLWSFNLVEFFQDMILKRVCQFYKERVGLRSAQGTLQRSSLRIFHAYFTIHFIVSSKIQRVRLNYKCCFNRIVDVGD